VTLNAPQPRLFMRRGTTGAILRVAAGCGWVLIALGCVPACIGSAGPKDPADAISSYAAALERRDAKKAYSLLSIEAQRRVPFVRFEAMMRENPEQVAALAKALAAGPNRMVVKATFAGPDEQTLELTLEDGHWKTNLSALDLYSQTDPLATLRSFVRAFEAARYDVLMRFVPEAESDGLSPDKLKHAWEGAQRDDMAALVDGLKASLPTAKAEQYGNRATIGYGSGIAGSYGSSGTVELVEENGLWKIVNF
jgi:hypothetical protein